MSDSFTLKVIDAIAEEASLTQVGDGLYRLDEELGLSMMAGDDEEAELFPEFGDTIAAHIDQEGTLVFERIHVKGKYQRFVYVVNAATIQSPKAMLIKSPTGTPNALKST